MEDVLFRKLVRASSSIRYFHPPLKEHFGNLRAYQLTNVHIHAYKEKRSHVRGALREELIELRTTLNFAKENNWINSFPPISIPKQPQPKDRFITREEADKLLEAANSMHLRIYIMIARSTAARKSAILGLTWDRIDFTNGRIDFRDPELAENNKRRAIVPIDKELLEILKQMLAYAQTPYVIEYMGKRVSDIKKSFKKACIKAGLKDVTPHTLKHSVISWLAADGYPLDQIAEFTATTYKTVDRVYRKYSPEYHTSLVKSLALTEGFANKFVKP